jgi:polysaccharide export outer membrane protein
VAALAVALRSRTRHWAALALAALLPLTGHPVMAADDTASSYRIATGDKLRITVYGHTDLSGEFEVDGAGRLSMPLIHSVPASGLTAQELGTAITARLKPDYLRDPQVSVEVLSYRPVYVLGEVQTPGSYPYASDMTVINAVALAGGFTYRARKTAIRIRRSANEKPQEIDAELDTPVLPGDVIEIPERFF